MPITKVKLIVPRQMNAHTPKIKLDLKKCIPLKIDTSTLDCEQLEQVMALVKFSKNKHELVNQLTQGKGRPVVTLELPKSIYDFATQEVTPTFNAIG